MAESPMNQSQRPPRRPRDADRKAAGEKYALGAIAFCRHKVARRQMHAVNNQQKRANRNPYVYISSEETITAIYSSIESSEEHACSRDVVQCTRNRGESVRLFATS